jgi:Spy/CpxP family protein refolding chaperone
LKEHHSSAVPAKQRKDSRMKTLINSLLLASAMAFTATAQDKPAGAQPRDRPEGDRPAVREGGDRAAMEQRMRARMGEGGGMMMRPQSALDRIMGGGDVEGGMLLRLLDNPRISEQIKLTDEQRTAIVEVIKDFDLQLDALRPLLDEAIKVQTALLRELKPDEEKLMKAVEEAWDLRTEVAKIQTRKLLALRSKLTVEQLDRAREMMESFRDRMGGDRGPRGEGGDRGPRGEGGDRGPRREGGDRGPRREGGEAPVKADAL